MWLRSLRWPGLRHFALAAVITMGKCLLHVPVRSPGRQTQPVKVRCGYENGERNSSDSGISFHQAPFSDVVKVKQLGHQRGLTVLGTVAQAGNQPGFTNEHSV